MFRNRFNSTPSKPFEAIPCQPIDSEFTGVVTKEVLIERLKNNLPNTSLFALFPPMDEDLSKMDKFQISDYWADAANFDVLPEPSPGPHPTE